jgi:hypothetical protein
LTRNILVLILALASVSAFSQTVSKAAPSVEQFLKTKEMEQQNVDLAEKNRELLNQAVYWQQEASRLEYQQKNSLRNAEAEGVAIGSAAAGIFLLGWCLRKIWLWVRPGICKRAQLLTLLGVALWCSVCAVLQVVSSGFAYHPISALVTAVLMSAPGALFGGVSFWWFSPWRPRIGKVERLW